MYLYFSITSRPWESVLPYESNPRTTAEEVSALPTEQAPTAVNYKLQYMQQRSWTHPDGPDDDTQLFTVLTWFPPGEKLFLVYLGGYLRRVGWAALRAPWPPNHILLLYRSQLFCSGQSSLITSPLIWSITVPSFIASWTENWSTVSVCKSKLMLLKPFLKESSTTYSITSKETSSQEKTILAS